MAPPLFTYLVVESSEAPPFSTTIIRGSSIIIYKLFACFSIVNSIKNNWRLVNFKKSHPLWFFKRQNILSQYVCVWTKLTLEASVLALPFPPGENKKFYNPRIRNLHLLVRFNLFRNNSVRREYCFQVNKSIELSVGRWWSTQIPKLISISCYILKQPGSNHDLPKLIGQPLPNLSLWQGNH